MIRKTLLARTALALVVAAGMGSAPAMAQKAAAASGPKLSLSKPFGAPYNAAVAALTAAKTRADVLAAKKAVDDARNAVNAANGAQRAAAMTAYNGAVAALANTVTSEKAAIATAAAAATTPDDRYAAAQLTFQLGNLTGDAVLQRDGLAAMIASGKVAAADLPRFNYFLGSLSFDAKDYAGAQTALKAAMDAGYAENDVAALYADSFLQAGQTAQGLQLLQQAISTAQAAGKPAPASWYRRGLGAAYTGKLLPQAAAFSQGLVTYYPTTENWSGAIAVVREIGNFQSQETLDLARLMLATNSFAEARDYVDYIQAADPRRSPGEVLKVLDLGARSGKLAGSQAFITEARTMAQGRLAADKTSLPALYRDASTASSTATATTAAADAALSYEDYPKALELYKLALGKPGADTARIQTRIGIADTMLRDYAGAKAAFAAVTGPRKPIADLWAIYASQKANPSAGTAPTSPAATQG
ncbi:hypothetical protein ACOYW6_03990 [Parablastomonas sp. CN1-191]|uniref:hypothetical protein n=1 Tax=Parablastomonas sp. CN1-191 TaxID=3400908 RepID=UPI003BF7CB6C